MIGVIFIKLMRKNPDKRLGSSEHDSEDVKKQSFFRVWQIEDSVTTYLLTSIEGVIRVYQFKILSQTINSLFSYSVISSREALEEFCDLSHPHLFPLPFHPTPMPPQLPFLSPFFSSMWSNPLSSILHPIIPTCSHVFQLIIAWLLNNVVLISFRLSTGTIYLPKESDLRSFLQL